MKNRSELREIIMKVMYQIYILEDAKLEYNLDYLIKEQLEVENEFINNTVNGILKEQVSIDLLANKYLKNWEINRLNKVDKSIVSLGIYELMYTDTPSIVAINEAIELSKKYSDDKVTKMVNAVLDEIFHNELEDQQ